jgi:hypothetical protein
MEFPGGQIIGIDGAIPEVGDEQVIAEFAEVRWGKGQPSGRGQVSCRCEALHQVSVGIEHIDNAQAFAGDIILFILVLLGIGHIESAIDVANAERRKTSPPPRYMSCTTRWAFLHLGITAAPV